ncbi:MAG: Uma2 family endonuclease [Chloroflexaceae bacterium]|nr:Uma2 family endonuclease [Chloroflexaceae bacterium]
MATASVSTIPLITGDELAALGDIGPCELVEGRIIRMSPTGPIHGEAESNLSAALLTYVRQHRNGRVMTGEVGIYTRRNPDTVRAADVIFISHERYARYSGAAYLDIAPDLVVEVLSPSNRWTEITQKLREYFAIGVRLVWVVDVEGCSVFAYRALTEVREFPTDADLPGDEVLPGLVLPVASILPA